MKFHLISWTWRKAEFTKNRLVGRSVIRRCCLSFVAIGFGWFCACGYRVIRNRGRYNLITPLVLDVTVEVDGDAIECGERWVFGEENAWKVRSLIETRVELLKSCNLASSLSEQVICLPFLSRWRRFVRTNTWGLPQTLKNPHNHSPTTILYNSCI